MTGADTRRRGGSWIGFKGEKNKKRVGGSGEGGGGRRRRKRRELEGKREKWDEMKIGGGV